MTKLKPVEFIFDPIYNTNIWYFYGWSREEMAGYLKKKYGYEGFRDVENVGGSVNMVPVGIKRGKEVLDAIVYCLWLPEPYNHPYVAHEIFHIVSRVLRNKVGMELTDESEEAFAYLLTYIYEEIEKIHLKRKIKKKTKKELVTAVQQKMVLLPQ